MKFWKGGTIMNFDIKNITGKVIINSKIVGTGFLVTKDLFITARHNIHQNSSGIPEEKEITIKIKEKEVNGITLNIKETYDKEIDVVFIKLNDPIDEINFSKIIKSSKSFREYKFKSYGYPKEKEEGYFLEGKILSDENVDENNLDIYLNVDREYLLEGYSGFSGAPILINNFIVGVLIAQESEKKLFGISFKLIREKLKSSFDSIFSLEEKELRKVFLEDGKINYNFFSEYMTEALNIAGPRYSKEYNIRNSTFTDLEIFSGSQNFSHFLNNEIKKLSQCLHHLEKCEEKKDFNISTNSWNDLLKIKLKYEEILNEIKNLIKKGPLEGKLSFFENLNNYLDDLSQNLKFILSQELVRFEEKYGKGSFENKSWKGYMASYLCTFPTEDLDNIKNLISITETLKNYFLTQPLNLYFAKLLLLKGKGGIGKTHSLCDIVINNIKKGIPALLFFGEYFRDKSPEEVILERLSLRNISFDDFLYSLNCIGDRLNKYILICIDAINEVNDNNYWNDYLNSFTEKIKKYSYVKFIISCRSLYLNEILSEEIIKKYIVKEHNGFMNLEQEAIFKYFDFYKIKIPYENKLQEEFTNPLFLKLYCETLHEIQNDKIEYNIEDLISLLENFFKIKNKKIAIKFSDYISPKDNIALECSIRIAESMLIKNLNYLAWKEVKKIIKDFLENEIGEKELSAKLILDELVSENILKEGNHDENTFSFAFEKLFDYLTAKYILDSTDISNLIENPSIYSGTLELLMILYKEKYNEEIIEKYNLNDDTFYNIFLSSLSWRKNTEIDNTTKKIFEICLKDSKLAEKSLFVLCELSLKENCFLNAKYFHSLLKEIDICSRDSFLGYYMLKSYERHNVVKALIDNSIFLKEKNINLKIIKLWIIILGWFISLNDIQIRDRASKGLTNLLKFYPETIFNMIKQFEDIDDDYIQERLWGSIYASLILNRNEVYIKKIVKYIYDKYCVDKYFPENVLLRDFLRNIAELAKSMDILEYDIENFRPPYKSRKIEKLKQYEILDKYQKLFFNCTESDFAIYTIPRKVIDYTFNKKEVGILVFNEIINSYYDENILNLDNYIDYTYGSLRNRDESVERVSKKYQNIVLRKVLGRIYDNYPYCSSEKILLPAEQGNEFRTIDLTILPHKEPKSIFFNNLLNYNFQNLNYREWFEKEDIEEISKKLIKNYYNEKEFLLLNGHFEINKCYSKEEKYPQKRLWLSINSYLIKKENLDLFNDWIKGKHFWNRWMPEGYNLYESWLGEYPWSPTYTNIFYENFNSSELPIDLIPTYNDFNNEKDSKFCSFNGKGYLKVPGKIFFDKLNLSWNGQSTYFNNKEIFSIADNTENSVIYANKKLLDNFLSKNGYSIVWTVLGEKQFFTKNFKGVGNAEFSQTFKYNGEIIPNHYYYKATDENYRIIFENKKEF